MRKSKKSMKEESMQYEVQLPYFLLQCKSQPGQSSQKFKEFYNYITSNTVITNLYSLCISSVLQGQNKQSCFYAEKLLFLSNEIQVQGYFVYLFGMCLLKNGQFSSVSKLIGRYQMTGTEFKILQGQALLGNKQYELCLDVLEGENNAQCDWIRGQCYEMLENKKEAMNKYQECIQKQPINVCAMEKLVDSFLMSQSEKEQLVNSLDLSNEEQWIKEYYKNKIEMQRGGGQNLYIQENLNEEKKKVLAQLNEIEMKEEKNIIIEKSGLSLTAENIYQLLNQKNNIDLVCMKAKSSYYSFDIPGSYEWCLKAIKQDPLYFEILPIYICCLAELNQVAELYSCAHNLIDNYHNYALSWFAVGTYYYLIKKFDLARKYFQKSVSMDQQFIYSWIGLAHSFAIQDESDQAMSVYRSISRLFPGCYQAHIYIGMEYLRTNNLKTAILSFNQAKEINGTDPMIYNELGVIMYKQKQYKEAKEVRIDQIYMYRQLFLTTLAFCQHSNHRIVESALQNLAHTYRKLQDYNNAIKILQKCVQDIYQLNPTSPQIYSALGFTYHLSQQSLNKAIEYYHKSLALKSDQAFVSEMLNKALTEASELPMHQYQIL